MNLSILDQSPISSGQTAQQALQNSIRLAQLGEKLGYRRYWISEHHDLYGLASPNPDVMLGVIGAQTKRIKIGAGAVLLPYYKPFRVAETYNLLATLFPKRIDLGLGRAPGGSAEVSLALSDHFLQEVNKFPEKIDELIKFIHGGFQANELFAKIKPTPIPQVPPTIWLLGTSEKSGKLAAERGLPYAFGHFMSNENGIEIVHNYKKYFKPNVVQKPYAIVTVHVICAENEAKAHDLAQSTLTWQILQERHVEQVTVPSLAEVNALNLTKEELSKMETMKKQMIIGSPEQVSAQLIALKETYGADEIMIVTITHDREAKFTSYKLISEKLIDH